MMKSKNVFVFGTSLFLVFGLVYVFSYIFNQNPNQNQSSHWEDKGKQENKQLKYSSVKDVELVTGTKRGWKPGLKYKIVDIEELHVRPKNSPKPKLKGSFKILHYNAELTTFNYAKDNRVIQNECSYTNCEFTSDLEEMSNSDAVIFNLPRDGSRFIKQPPERKQDQVWILSDTHPRKPKDLDIPALDAKWRNTINWTMSYRFDSDILWTHGTLKSRRPEDFPNKDYYVMASHRQRAMTVVTNCREYETTGMKEYIKQIKSKIYLDIFGDCKDTKRLPGDLKKVVLDYFFFFVFEEILCPNFFSETFFSFFDLDIVIVLHRPGDNVNMIPRDAFVIIEDFQDLDGAISYLKSVGPVEIVEYIRRKDYYVSAPAVRWQCDICQKMNNKGDNRHVYKSLSRVLERNMCAQNGTNLKGKRAIGTQIIILVAVFCFLVFMFRNYNCRCYWFEDNNVEKESLPGHARTVSVSGKGQPLLIK